MTDHIVVFDAPERLIGQIVDVDIQDASSFTLYGRVNVDSLQDRESLSIPTPRRRSLELL
jgi:hypothetical protein